MTRQFFSTFLMCCVAIAAINVATASSPQQSEPPTAEVIAERTNAWMEWYRGADPDERTPENMGRKLEEVLEGIDLSELSLKGVQQLRNLARFSTEVQSQIDARLDALMKQDDADGAVAAFLRLQMDQPAESFIASARDLFEHPGYKEAMRSGELSGLLGTVGSFPKESVEPLLPHILGMADLLDPSVATNALGAAAQYAVALHGFDDVISEAKRDAVRRKVRDVIQSRIEEIRASEDADTNAAEWLGRQVTMLESNYGKGKLIDNSAPEIYFDWSSDDSLRTLDDLKGKVVILDFWATWCGPCIATFPNVRELVAHYDGYDVAVIGVTSIQGRHYPGGGEAPIDVEGDPDREYELMTEFMEAKEMTWTVAFSRQEVYNPEYGVRGIPHVAILDPEGNVRYNGLHPGGSLADKFEKIDALLKEAGMKAPPAPDADTEATEEE